MIIDYRQHPVDNGIKIYGKDSDKLTDMILDTQYPMIKQAKEIDRSHTFSANISTGVTNLFSINHNMDYIPATMVFAVLPDGADKYSVYLPTRYVDILPMYAGVCYVEIMYYVDSTKIQVYAVKTYYGTFAVGDENTTNMNGKTLDFKIYVFADAGA